MKNLVVKCRYQNQRLDFVMFIAHAECELNTEHSNTCSVGQASLVVSASVSPGPFLMFIVKS